MHKSDAIDNRYYLEKMIGTGGSSKVYLAKDSRLDRMCAVKIVNIDPDSPLNEYNEVQILKDLSHPLLPRILDIITDEEYVYIVRDYCEGVTIREFIDRGGPLGREDFVKVMKQILSALKYLHSFDPPFIYRDLKPSNVIIDDKLNIKLIDFGITRTYSKDKLDDTYYIGSIKYAAPEQHGLAQSDERTDVYSAALLMYYLVSGEDYSLVDPDRVWDKFNAKSLYQLRRIIAKASQVDMELRYPSISALEQELLSAYSLDVNVSSDIVDYYDDKTLPIDSITRDNRKTYHTKTAISIMGLKENVGCTHIAYLLGMYLSKCNMKTVLVERGIKPSLRHLYSYNRQKDIASVVDTEKLHISRLKVITDKSAVTDTTILSDDYDYFIFDYGSAEDSIESFLHAQIKLFILPSSPFSLNRNTHIIRDLLNYKDVIFVSNLSDGEYDVFEYLDIPPDRGVEFPYLLIGGELQDDLIERLLGRGIKTRTGFFGRIFR